MRTSGRVLSFFVLAICFAPTVLANVISFELTSASLSTISGSTVTFDGTVTNHSGTDLNATDFFFNFFGYNATSVNPIQDLGVTTNFSISNGNTSATVPLFDVVLGAVTSESTFPIQVQLEDVNFDLSAVQTATVSVPGSVPTPEPATLLLVGSGLTAVLARRRRYSRGREPVQARNPN